MMCFAFESRQRFNVISGDVTLQLCMQVIMEYIIVGLYLALGLELPNKAARLRDTIADLDYDQLTETLLWKMYEGISNIVALTVMPALIFAHWVLGKILRA